MAVLIQDDAQVRALNEINTMLDEVKVLNDRISSEDPIRVEAGKKVFVTLDDNLAPKLISILKNQRERRVKDIKAKAAKFHIALSDDERALLGNETVTE